MLGRTPAGGNLQEYVKKLRRERDELREAVLYGLAAVYALSTDEAYHGDDNCMWLANQLRERADNLFPDGFELPKYCWTCKGEKRVSLDHPADPNCRLGPCPDCTPSVLGSDP